jgi:hypothetical protein
MGTERHGQHMGTRHSTKSSNTRKTQHRKLKTMSNFFNNGPQILKLIVRVRIDQSYGVLDRYGITILYE